MVYTISYNVREGLKMSKKMLLPVGVVVLIIGVIILLLNPDPATTNLEIARNATNAREAAKAISSNNQTYAWMYSIGMFCSGFGLSLTIGGILVKFLKKD